MVFPVFQDKCSDCLLQNYLLIFHDIIILKTRSYYIISVIVTVVLNNLLC